MVEEQFGVYDFGLIEEQEEQARRLDAGGLEVGFRAEHKLDSATNDHRDFPNFTRGLVKRGYSDEQVAGIIGGNFVSVFEQVCG
jgi:microsomal dipeptidase-like Zn-dependent dipeptidase